jgi:hypothetical protein
MGNIRNGSSGANRMGNLTPAEKRKRQRAANALGYHGLPAMEGAIYVFTPAQLAAIMAWVTENTARIADGKARNLNRNAK